MKIKELKWASNGDVCYNLDTIPQIVYFIRHDWDFKLQIPMRRVEFTHGYVPDILKRSYTDIVGRYNTTEEAKLAAQAHFERYIKESFFTEET